MKKDGILLIYRLAAILFFKNISNSVYDGMTIISGVIMFTGIINIVKNIIKK